VRAILPDQLISHPFLTGLKVSLCAATASWPVRYAEGAWPIFDVLRRRVVGGQL
jgi:hypothetical protein